MERGNGGDRGAIRTLKSLLMPSSRSSDEGRMNAGRENRDEGGIEHTGNPEGSDAESQPGNLDETSLVSNEGGRSEGTPAERERENAFHRIIESDVADLDALRDMAWKGVPEALRPTVWKLLLGYLPANKLRRARAMEEKRATYRRWVNWYCSGGYPGRVGRTREHSSCNDEGEDDEEEEADEEDDGALKQIRVDAPRTAPDVGFFRREEVRASVERVLYIWAVRHPASGYVQGINDVLTPFLAVFLSEHFNRQGSEGMEEWNLTSLPTEKLHDVEADCYWCLERMLSAIHDHYTPDQPGIHARTEKMREVLFRVNRRFAAHLEENGVEFMQFAFRWINCLLLRELPFRLAPRLWDTFIAEGHRFRDFIPYACAALLDNFSGVLMSLDFSEMLMLLQRLPTSDWDQRSLEAVLSQAHVWRETFERASRSHFS